MTKKKLINLNEYIRQDRNWDDVLMDLRAENIKAEGKYIDDLIIGQIDRGEIAVDVKTKEYNPPPKPIPRDCWYTHSYNEDENTLNQSDEVGTVNGFNSFSDIQIWITEDISKPTKRRKRSKKEPEWESAVKRYISYVHHYKNDLGLAKDTELKAKPLWDLLKAIKKYNLFSQQKQDYKYEDITVNISDDIADEIQDLTEVIQSIEPPIRENHEGKQMHMGYDVLKFRPNTNTAKDSITFGTFENCVNDYKKRPKSFFRKDDLKKMSPERGGEN